MASRELEAPPALSLVASSFTFACTTLIVLLDCWALWKLRDPSKTYHFRLCGHHLLSIGSKPTKSIPPPTESGWSLLHRLALSFPLFVVSLLLLVFSKIPRHETVRDYFLSITMAFSICYQYRLYWILTDWKWYPSTLRTWATYTQVPTVIATSITVPALCSTKKEYCNVWQNMCLSVWLLQYCLFFVTNLITIASLIAGLAAESELIYDFILCIQVIAATPEFVLWLSLKIYILARKRSDTQFSTHHAPTLSDSQRDLVEYPSRGEPPTAYLRNQNTLSDSQQDLVEYSSEEITSPPSAYLQNQNYLTVDLESYGTLWH
ncbi:hypothetical protein L207DRAFT_308454 [Hyaloscypha variabilis F]|uniref:Uncharacterized protein n=1 Tax=Hyaloscypha variabilis (strain UAMH 11265 / GT02V1 / F) TaxID=1149755 RepID=A0A2J6RUY5_HYAVF|nr:hypothetical protein L207DRAFT_308454 [Hyaloscypha variabilis F]